MSRSATLLRFLPAFFLLWTTVACDRPAPPPGGQAAAAPTTAPDPTAAPDPATARLEIREPRAHVMPGGMGAVYFSVVNPGTESDRLVSIETAMAQGATTHESVDQDGVSRMLEHPEGFEIPAGATVELAPGGKHVMLTGVAAGEDILRLRLHFERAGAIDLEAPVVAMGEKAP